MDRREYRTLVLAGLLHDVGKLLNKPAPEKGKKHAQYGDEFLRRDDIATLFRKRFDSIIDHQALCDLVLFHDPYVEEQRKQKVRTSLLRMIRRADGYSAGERDLSKLYGRTASGDLPLDTIFAFRYLGRRLGRSLDDNRPQYKPAILTPETAFPIEGETPLALTLEDYESLQDDFCAAFRHALTQAEAWDQLEAWTYSLLERFTWAVPSALHKNPRVVSLFDHARTSCAMAAALYLRHVSKKGDRNQRLFLLVKGDVSGVQDYIYSVANVGPGGVAKRLRARSFFITALTEVVSHRLRDDLVDDYQLPIASTIFAGGGQFVLLAPNLKSVQANLADTEEKINAWLWNEFQGDLAVVFGSEEVGGTEVAIKPRKRGRNICQVLADLDHKVAEAKQRRLGVLFQESGKWKPDAFLWAPEGKNYELGACPSCGRLPALADENEPNIDKRLCHRCLRDRILSERIVDARCIGYWRGDPPQADDSGWLHRRRLTFFDQGSRRHVVLLSNLDELARIKPAPYQLDGFGYDVPTEKAPASGFPPLVRHFANYVPRFQSRAELETFCTEERGCVHGRFCHDETCGILVKPTAEGNHGDEVHHIADKDYPILQTFGCLSAAAAEWHQEKEGEEELWFGSQFLGVLRADADHLGRLFTDSFEEEVRLSKKADPETRPVRSLSRLATLSRMTDLFFSGWVNHTLTCPPEGKRYDRIYTIYTGGDDLCLVGPWDVIIDFARHLAAEFERYVAGNSNVTLSAAIAVTQPKFPIATSAKLAGQWLNERAKDKGRNRLHLFGVTTRLRDLADWENLQPDLREQLAKLEEHATLLLDQLWPWAELLDDELRRWREAKPARYPISTAFAHRLLSYAERARRWEEEKGINAEDLLYLAHLAYDLGRNVIESEALGDRIKESLTSLTKLSNSEMMAAMRMPISYALCRNRERSRQDDH